jgi:hypothetical protein
MLTAEARIQTSQPSRYLIQLCRHASSINHKILRHAGRAQARPEIQHVEWSDSHGTLDLGWGRCTLHAEPGALTVRAEAASEETLQRLQDLIARNLERFGRREQLKVSWERPGTPAARVRETG